MYCIGDKVVHPMHGAGINKDVKKIKEFVVAIDTSASCRGKVVQAFLNKTYSILKRKSLHNNKSKL